MSKAIQGEQPSKNPLDTKVFNKVDIVRSGDRIIIPDGMSYPTAREWIGIQEQAEESLMNVHYEIKCFPLDGARALQKAMFDVFGFVDFKTFHSFFGDRHPTMITVQTGIDTYEQIVWGALQPPYLEGGYIQASADEDPMTFFITGKVKRKFDEKIKQIALLTQKYIKEDSIYKGKAINVDLSYLRTGDDGRAPQAPEFMDLRQVKEDDLILSVEARTAISTSVYLRLKRTAECEAQKIPLKHGVLLMGSYGTGKTLTARVTAKMAVDNNWTFIYIKHSADLASAIRFAGLYAPAVIFAEDIDKATENGRTEAMNEILNTIDGIDTKTQPIITVLTTNHPENIDKSFLRAGRIDTVVNLGVVDATASIEFAKRYSVNEQGITVLADDADYDAIGEALKDLVPAFIAGIIQQAKALAMYREGGDITGKVTTQDIQDASATFREHIKMATMDKTKEATFVRVKDAVEYLNKQLKRSGSGNGVMDTLTVTDN